MKRFQFYILSLIIIASCGQPVDNSMTPTVSTVAFKIPTAVDSNSVILKFDSTGDEGIFYRQLFKNAVPTNLSVEEIAEIDKLTLECLNKVKTMTINLTHYKRQYVPTINDKGEKLIWVNYFCIAFDTEWKKIPLIIFDGGQCFFQLKINLTTKKYYDFWQNAIA